MKILDQAPVCDKSVGIWIRVSTEDQVKGESPEHHERRARHYAEAKGWNVSEVYHLEAVSGKSVLQHPETQRMLSDVLRGHISAIIFSKLARLARNTKELLDFADIFRSCAADLVSLQESIDTSSPAGRLFYTMIAAMAQWEREEISERVAASVPIRAQLGKSLGGQAPFGYQWVDKKLIPHPEEAPVRRQIYELFAEHRRRKTVARLLNDAGHRTRNGSRFSDTTVTRLLEDPTAKGIRRVNYTESLGDKKHWKLKPESDWVFQEVEAIVPEELWGTCNSILGRQRASTKRPTQRTVQLFAGVTFCACGSKMYVPTKSSKYTCFSCRNKVPIDDLEAVFYEQLRDFLLSPDDIAEHLKKVDTTIGQKEELVVGLARELEKVSAEMDIVYRLYAEKQISSEGFGKRNRPLEERAKQIEEEIPRLQAEIDLLKITLLSSDENLNRARDLYGQWPSLSFEDKRRIVENIVERITVGDTEISIELYYLPSAKDAVKEQRNPVLAGISVI